MPRIFWAAVVFIFVLLNGCSHVARKDGPPDFYVDESKIPNATPKLEPISKYGNMASYSVFGKRYYVLPTSKNYEERGIASWYGTQFHRHHTSDGERYNMLAMTAAHKSLPLPTYVQVTNLKNGRKVIVKVNDRGPFESNRLIDLSYVAAKKLGMLGRGTAYVDVKAIDPRDAYEHRSLMVKNKIPHAITVTHNVVTRTTTRYYSKASTPTFIPSSNLYLQVGAFRNKALAIKLQKHLASILESPVTIIPSNHIYRVQVGPFKDIASADRINKRIHAVGLRSKRIVEEREGFDIT